MNRLRTGTIAAVALLVIAGGAGCDREPDVRYGTVVGESLNGLSAFVQVLRDAGHTTTTRRRLVESIVGRHDVAIVLADGCGRPAAETLDILHRFLEADGRQTLVFVVRDSDAAVDYWTTVASDPDLPPEKSALARRHGSEADRALRSELKTTFDRVRAEPAALGYGVKARSEAAACPITVDIVGGGDETNVTARWPLHRRLVLPRGMRVLWAREGEPLLASSTGRDRTLLLASAAPLLNAGLVDPGNRRLAGELAALLPESSRVVVVGSADVAAAEEEPGPSAWRLLAIQPLPWIFAQAVVAIGLFCWWRSPIFGRPVGEDARLPQDFGHHVEALAALLRRSRDDGFARGRLEAWEPQSSRDQT